MRIGVDLDGVLADFNTAFIDRVISVTGKDFFPPRPFDIPTWDYPQAYGYTEAEVSAVWEAIKADPTFWAELPPYPWTREVFSRLDELADTSDVYFITSRPGLFAKQQTEAWVQYWGGPLFPTVLISSMKGWCCKALKIDAYIDDRTENVFDVRAASPSTRIYLQDQPWNREGIYDWKGITRVQTPLEMLSLLDEARSAVVGASADAGV